MGFPTVEGRLLKPLWILGASLLLLPGCSRHQDAAPRSPRESLQSMQVHPDFRVELFASEPEVVDPVEMAFDARGRIFVAEMLDLPYDPEAGQEPRSRIRLLEDSDGDGLPDRSRIFADRLQQVTSVLPWKGGLLVTAAPDIICLKDTSGDGRADRREVLFTGDVSANLVHRDLIRPDGVSFLASRPPGESDREFLASTDVWFRPCNFANGPDGALYMVDMYREFIETPESVPEALKKDIDFYSGDRMGRIYRIVPRTAPPRAATPVGLADVASEKLLAHLAHPNVWWRLTAHRLLVERQDRAVVSRLAAMAAGHASPRARLHALNLLEGLGALETTHLQSALEDNHPEVRVHAVRLSEAFPELGGRLTRMVDDPSPRVRFQLALSLGEFSGPEVVRALAGLARHHSGDPWFRMAVLSSEAGSSGAMLESLLSSRAWLARKASETLPLFGELASVIGARNRSAEIEAEDLTLLRAAIAEVRASSMSLMPDGFEDGINPRQMADLIACLQGANLH